MRDTAARFEITYLNADDGHVTHTADAVEVRRLVEWAGRHGVKVRVRPCNSVAAADHETGPIPVPRHSQTSERRSTVSNESQGTPPSEEGGGGSEEWKEKGVALRALFYIGGTHVFAGFIWLLFYLGEHAHK